MSARVKVPNNHQILVFGCRIRIRMSKDTKNQKLPLKAVMFDLDGTLVISTIGFMKFRTRLLKYIKSKGADMANYSMKETTVSMISKFEREMRERKVDKRTMNAYLDDIDRFLDEIELENIEKTRPVPGAEELLRMLRSRGIKIGILTRGSPKYASRALEIAGLAKYVDAVVSRDRGSGIAPKPHPESARALARKLGVELDEAVMIGDYSIDYLCAKDSGVSFIGIASEEESRRSLIESGCSDIISNLGEFQKRIGL